MFRSIKTAILAAPFAMLMASAAEAAVVYTQPLNIGQADASQNDTKPGGFGNFATSYESFQLAAATTITAIDFYGHNSDGGTITGFTAAFYADNAGVPGSALYTTHVAGNGSQTPSGSIFSYSLSVNFAAAAGTTYWLSLVADMEYPPQWYWAHGSGGDDYSYLIYFNAPYTTDRDHDLAFTLRDATAVAQGVPEPATWAMMIGGFALTGAAMRRRKAVIRFA